MTKPIDWTNVKETAKVLAGNWKEFDSLVWWRREEVPDPENWCVCYTSSGQSGILELSNEFSIQDMLSPYARGEDPDVVFDSHKHWAVGHIEGFSVRVYRPGGTVTDAFRTVCKIREKLDNYPILDEHDYSEREFNTTLENYRHEMGKDGRNLPDDWAAKVYDWFVDQGLEKYTENRDDNGGWAHQDKLLEALRSLGLLPSVVIAENEPSAEDLC